MSLPLRRASMVLVGFALLALALFQGVRAKDLKPLPAPQKEPTPNETNDFSQAISLPTDNKLQKKIEAAQDLIRENVENPEAGTWGEAARLLQSLLDAKEDVFVQVAGKDARGKESTHLVSVKTEANRLLGTMPPKGREFYQLRYGGDAKTQLELAKSTSDPQILADVAKRYLHTDAGSEAMNLFGTYHLDRGRYSMAAICFERLMTRDGVDKLSSATLVKAVLAFRRTGDKANADLAWKQLASRARDGLRLGDQTVAIGDLEQALDRYNVLARNIASASDWLMYGGNASRSAQANGGAPFMETKWKQPLIRERDTQRWIDQAVKYQHDHSQPVLTSFFPIAATIHVVRPEDPKKADSRKVEMTVPLLVYRSYWGIHAVDLRTGKLEWEARSDVSLDRMARDSSKLVTLNQWIGVYLQANPSLLYENSTLGMLSTDNKNVYAVEDLALPPHPNWIAQYGMNNGWNGGGTPHFGSLNDAVFHSKLQAFDLDSGKLVWEIGGREGDVRGSMPPREPKDTYFLGPPLPLGGKLYVLAEKNQELNLICLDPATGDISWKQMLATARDKMLQDVGRRIRCASLAYGEGILVCPTNAGAILGVDLLSRSLVWAHAYREKSATPQPEDQQRMIMRRGGMPMQVNPETLAAEWKASSPVIQDGKVVFTAPDGSSVHCLNLRDGSLVWKAPRQDDLYLGGVYNGKVVLVGKAACRALSLADGKQLWRLDTGLPSGQGVASNNVYYVPLKAAGQAKEPEVCAIDIDKGEIVAHTKSRKQDVPGNLLFYDGDVVSQTATDLVAYPQLKVKLAKMNEQLTKNPSDPIGLTERGELRLDQGDLPGAIEDLRLALASKPPEEILPKTRLKLYETLTELLQRNFSTGEKYLDEYEKLCKVEAGGSLTEEQAKEEQQRRQSNYLCLLAKGREKQGRLVDAYEAYLKFGALSANKERVTVIDEPNVLAAPDVWAQGRIAAMVAAATPEQRQPLEKKIAEQWRLVKDSGNTEKLREFVALFGSLFAVGREARLQLAGRLIEEEGPGTLLEAERHLILLSRTQDDPQLAAGAVEGLARLYTRKGLLEDAASCYRTLGKQYATIVIRDGKTGRDFYDDMATDKRFLPFVEEPGVIQIPAGSKIDAREERGNFNTTRPLFTFEPDSDVLPFFRRHRITVDLNYSQFKLLDGGTNEERWNQPLEKNPAFANHVNFAATVPFRYQTSGHLLVLPMGNMVYGLDPVNKQKLWEKNLNSLTLQNNQMQAITDPQDGSVQLIYPDGWITRLGQAGPVEASYVCLQTRDGLLTLDPLSGRTLWTRSGVSLRSHLFGDGEHIYLVEKDANNNIIGTQALRAHDGVSVTVPDFGALYKNRLRVLGRNLLLSESAQGGLVLRLYDVLTGKDVWKKNFAANAVVLKTENPNLVGAIEPDGKVTVVDLRNQKDVFRTSVDPKDLDKVQAVYLLQDSLHYYLAFNGPADTNLHPWGGPHPNLMAGSGMRALPVNGKVYAFDPRTGKLRWFIPVEHQMIVLQHMEELPFLLFTARYQKAVGAGGNRFPQQGCSIKSIDKRTGKLLYDQPEMINGTQFYALNVDMKEGKIDFVGYNLKVSHILPDSPASVAGAGSKGGSTAVPQSQAPPPITVPLPAAVPGAVQVRVRVMPVPAAIPQPPPPPAPPPLPPERKP